MMRAKWCVVLFFVFAWVMVVNWCSCDAATANMPYFASEVGSSDSVASLVVNTTYYIGLGIDNELYPGSTIYIKTSPRYIDSDGNVSYGVSTESITKPKRQDDAYKNYCYWISASFSEAGVFMIEPRIVFANGSDYDWDPILISVVDRSPEVYQNLSSQTVLEGTAVTFTANAYAGTNLQKRYQADSGKGAELFTIQKKIAKTEEKISNLIDLRTEGDISIEEYQSRRNKLNKELSCYERQLQEQKRKRKHHRRPD